MTRRIASFLLCLLLAGCIAAPLTPTHRPGDPTETDGVFVMPDGAVLPYREWLPAGTPSAVVLALHGMNDSRDAWEVPAPDFVAAGIAVYSPDLSGFGATELRGYWAGSEGLVREARMMAKLLRARYPDTKLILMAESMGAATAMVMATEPSSPPVDGYVLIAPAVWGRKEMGFVPRALLWLANHTLPGVTLTGRGFVKVTATDNREALMRLSNDPLTIHATRVDAVEGLVNLMDRALASAPYFHAQALFLYGGHDQLIPPNATAAMWRALPEGPVRGFYTDSYHLMLRDKKRDAPIGDILAWIKDPAAPLPSGADKAAAEWLAKEDGGTKTPPPPLMPVPETAAIPR